MTQLFYKYLPILCLLALTKSYSDSKRQLFPLLTDAARPAEIFQHFHFWISLGPDMCHSENEQTLTVTPSAKRTFLKQSIQRLQSRMDIRSSQQRERGQENRKVPAATVRFLQRSTVRFKNWKSGTEDKLHRRLGKSPPD